MSDEPDKTTEPTEPSDASAFGSSEDAAPTDALFLDPQERLHIARLEPPRSRVLSYAGLGVALGLAVLLLGICAFSVPFIPATASQPAVAGNATAKTSLVASTSTPVNRLDFATQGPNPTPLPYFYPTPTFETIETPTPLPPPPAPPTDPGKPPPAPGNHAVLFIAPLNLTVSCKSRQARTSFFIVNLGTAALRWSADANDITLSQTAGTLNPGQRQGISVTNITRATQILVQADNVDNNPQTVTIVCV